MKYFSTFKTITDETIEVKIITNNSESQETELTLAGESPVIISQTSSDGLFSPIKSRSCTITIISTETFFDMYSGSSHGTKVIVKNVTRDETLFFGYLTPCEYNQPFVYLNEIELEAVDAVSTLQDYKYQYQNRTSSSVITIASILRYCLTTTAGYTGGIYVQNQGLVSKIAREKGFAPTEAELIAEEAFFDDEDPMTCYEVLEEICNFYNLSLVPYGNDVYLIDYEIIANYDTLGSDNWLKFKNITNGSYSYLSSRLIPTNLTIYDYCGDDQNVELDEVFNKVIIKAETRKIEKEDILQDPLDDISSSDYFNTIQSGMNRSDGQTWTHVTRLFEYIHGSYGTWLDSDSDWQTLSNANSQFSSYSYSLTDNFSNVQTSQINAYMEFPYTTGYLFNQIVGQTCMPAQLFGYQSSKEMPYSSNWDDVLLFFPQTEWIADYYRNNGSIIFKPGSVNLYDYWTNDFYENHMGGTYPVLRYRGKKEFQFSPVESTKTNYLAFTGDLLWQQNCKYDDVNYHLWTMDESNHLYGGTLFPIKEAGAHNTHSNAPYERNPGTGGYNTGWPMLKVKLKIGNKYWKDYYWTEEESTFWIPYHKENVVSDTETLIWSDYNKPVTNHNYTYKIGKDAFVIPITASDHLFGKLSIDIYMPRIPWSDGLFYSTGSGTTPHPPQGNITVPTRMYINYQKTPPVIYMKNLSFELISTENDRENWYKDFSDIDKEDDDITYSNTINSNNVTEFDDLTLKINTYNSKQPIASSYIIEPRKCKIQNIEYDIASRNFAKKTTGTYIDDNKYMFSIFLEDFDTNYWMNFLEWESDHQGLYHAQELVPVRVKSSSITTDAYLQYIYRGPMYVVLLNIGDVHTTAEEAVQDSAGNAFYNSLNGQIDFLPPDSQHVLPPLSLYPTNMRINPVSCRIFDIEKTSYHNEGFYREKTQSTSREETNVVNKYVGHHSTPKKIYNCNVHGYYEPWKCVKPTALNNIKMIVDEQEFDVKANANELKLIEY